VHPDHKVVEAKEVRASRLRKELKRGGRNVDVSYKVLEVGEVGEKRA